MKTVLAPTDFSPVSINAVHYAADLAVHLGANLTLLHVFQLPMTTINEVPVPPAEIKNSLRDIDEKMAELKADLLVRTQHKITIKAESTIGGIRSEIKTIAALIRPIVIVMASHGPGAVERFLLGSNTQWATKQLPWPLIIVPKGTSFQKIDKVGLAWNYRKISDRAFLSRLKDFIRELEASLHVVCVIKDPSDKFSDQVIRESDSFKKEFEEFKPQYSFIVNNDIIKAVNVFAADYGIDMVIVIPGKHEMLDRIFHHSQSKELALNARLPVLSLHE